MRVRRMRFVAAAAGLALFAACDSGGGTVTPEPNDGGTQDSAKADGATTTSESARRANLAFESTVNTYWNGAARVFVARIGTIGLDYWWQAHALEMTVDRSERRGDNALHTMLKSHREGVFAINGGATNDYYDDMLWMAIALLRAHEHTGDESHLTAVETLWTDIKGGWNETHGGGIAWRKSQLDYKNVVANAPAAILAFRLYRLGQRPADLEWANKTLDWVSDNLVNSETGAVWDGKGMNGGDSVDKRLFTYTHGVYLGALVERYRHTGKNADLDAAVKTATFAMDEFSTDGILKDEGDGDGGLFRGILVRYLGELAKELDARPQDKQAVETFLRTNADAAWQNRHVEGDAVWFGKAWGEPAGTEPEHLSVQLSANMLFEAVARLD